MKKIFMIFISFIFMMSINAFEIDINSDYAFVYNVKENKIMSNIESEKLSFRAIEADMRTTFPPPNCTTIIPDLSRP